MLSAEKAAETWYGESADTGSLPIGFPILRDEKIARTTPIYLPPIDGQSCAFQSSKVPLFVGDGNNYKGSERSLQEDHANVPQAAQCRRDTSLQLQLRLGGSSG